MWEGNGLGIHGSGHTSTTVWRTQRMPHKPRQSDLSPNMEDYLETIYLQDIEGQAAKVKNIADAMGVSKPSVTEALSVLQDRGLVLHQKYGDIELTDKGRHTAEEIYRRHTLLKAFFEGILGMDSELAEDDACKVEHLISDTATDRFDAFLRFIEKATSNGSDYKGFLKEFHQELQGE